MSKRNYNGAVVPYVARFPLTLEGLDAMCGSREPNFIDQVHVFFRKAWAENERFRAFINTAFTSDSVEGSVKADRFEASRIIRELAQASGNQPVGNANLEKIRQALVWVENRHVDENGQSMGLNARRARAIEAARQGGPASTAEH